jgi:C4-dicarboxylate-specific signal transduction histidine kinase
LYRRCHAFSNLTIASVEWAVPAGTALAMEALGTRAFENGAALALAVISIALVAVWLLERRRRLSAENLHAASQERLALISSIASLGFWSWDAATDRVWASKHARGILALDHETALTGASLIAAIHPEDRPSVLRIINSPGPAIDTMEMELRVVGGGNEIRFVTAKACAYRDAKKAVNRVVGYVVDDGQRKRSAAELLKMQHKLKHLARVAMLGELSGALAHELQQPLTAILCNANAAQLLSKKDKLDVAELQDILQEIVSDDKNAGQIIQRLRALLLRGETQFQHLEIGDLLGDVLALARGKLRERNVQVNTRVDRHLPEIQGDRVELQQVLLNLLLNASESMNDNPARDRRIEVVVAHADDEGAVRISVLDCGKGIDADKLERVFEPFFSTKDGGMGLGLAISHSIVIAHGGRLWATNRPDRGAAFHFTLPIKIGKESHERHNEYSVYSG